MASRNSCKMKRRLKKVKPLWVFTVSMRKVFWGLSVRMPACCNRNSACHSKPRAAQAGGPLLAQQQGIVCQFFASHPLEHVKEVFHLHASTLLAGNVKHHLTLVQH